MHRHAFAFFGQRRNRHARKHERIAHRHNRPQSREYRPAVFSTHRQEDGGKCDDRHGPPAVKRMQKAHRRSLVVRRAGLHDRADQHLNEPAADGVQQKRRQKPEKRMREQKRENPHPQKPRRHEHMRRNDTRPVADPVDDGRRKRVDEKLQQEIKRHEQRDLRQLQRKRILENQKQQRHEVIDDSLRHISHIACTDGCAVGPLAHLENASSKKAQTVLVYRRIRQNASGKSKRKKGGKAAPVPAGTETAFPMLFSAYSQQ